MSRSSWSRWSGAAGRALLPFAGLTLDRHLANFSVLNAPLPSWSGPHDDDRVLIVSPHPDDEILGCGGLLARCAARNIASRVVFLTNGDGSRTTQIALNVRQPKRANKTLFDIARERQDEAVRAAQNLGLSASDVQFLSFPDGGLTRILQGGDAPFRSATTGRTRVEYERAVRRGAAHTRAAFLDVLTEAVNEFAPTLILTTPHFDTHLDHAASAHALSAILPRLSSKPRVGFFLIHYGIWPVPNGFRPDLRLVPPARLLRAWSWQQLPLSEREIEVKREALVCHATQLASTPRYLHAFVRSNELFLIS